MTTDGTGRGGATTPYGGRCRLRGLVSATLLLSILTAAGCATAGFARPTGPSTPFPEGAAVWTSLSSACSGLTSYRAQLRVSGRLHGQRVPGLTAGVAGDAGRLGVVITLGSRPLFNVAGTAADVTMLLHREQQVARGPAADIVEALVGVRISPARLMAVLSGCVSSESPVSASSRTGNTLRLETSEATIYLQEQGAGWRLRAAEIDGLLADYVRVEADQPREVVLRQPDVALALRVVEFERNPTLPAAAFQLVVPDSFAATSIEVLRQNGPLGGRPTP